ncbi:hypothetical protein LRC39_15130 [Rhodopseudomonas sp. P1]
MWRPIVCAPFDVDLELAVIDGEGCHALVFPCRRGINGWRDMDDLPIFVSVTHWRLWLHTQCVGCQTEPAAASAE